MQDAKILLIDDDQHIYDAVRELLGEACDQILWANRPEAGIRLALHEAPDLILLDVNMPNMDGLKVCRHLKETERTRDIAILFLTVERNIDSLARALDLGGADYILKPFNEIDLRARVRAALRTKRMIDLLKEQARIDALTGLSNRAALDAALDSALASYQRLGHPFALLMLDVDHFKEINDLHGHGVGDDLLRQVAQALRVGSRPYDTPCRFGGDEFGVVLGQTQGPDADRAAARILQGLEGVALRREDGTEIVVTCSAGLASTSVLTPELGADDMIKAADTALYRAKREGRNRLCTAKASPL
jgi:diguanylate cyclase (GGDEF)-like protein